MEAPHWTAGQHLSPRAETTLITPSTPRAFLRRPSLYFSVTLLRLLPINASLLRLPTATNARNRPLAGTSSQTGGQRSAIPAQNPPAPKRCVADLTKSKTKLRTPSPSATAVAICSLAPPILTLTPSEPVSRSLPQGSRSHSIVHLELLCASGGGLGRAEECCFVNSTRRTVKWCSLGEQGFDVGQRGC
ncbi:hypothetical protein FA13DRAFT_1175451 [Coprinellus micaceus]|uniref:Uncharacterized protein n=1 Tax=Coprinellus micaceus TaxID=71717 RepID=A0A4Y7SVH5_COPMI|nr:hypothetical protein FA13DRAFT_1175451 [Coprinellus micaceus]